jgi:hypothetical protein
MEGFGWFLFGAGDISEKISGYVSEFYARLGVLVKMGGYFCALRGQSPRLAMVCSRSPRC